ncbi:hypothetical protein Mp_1g01150 [Marchantia polymorpha subsp. ruderalis]|uniref:Uncharacterized protein n=2 Tax=Marchantia polymorpha TaxID=3197 RepID=A0AAF6AK79_MARPO|nr:hypothetical protein MARPO_0029s0131 [Marchantia polymorpha]BBM96849.1 hypothetical protein Mp_1g01150 [Marchantia polymorpha subsp. ruderalis]|eukprot:PTQ42634.1 hypothetical protein MARPO_0029s0131 [Marchantia polymorpha]
MWVGLPIRITNAEVWGVLAYIKCLRSRMSPIVWEVQGGGLWLMPGYACRVVDDARICDRRLWPAPHDRTKAELRRSNNDGGKSQNEILFNLGNAISGLPIRIGTNQLPKPPIIAGITIKKIIKKA